MNRKQLRFFERQCAVSDLVSIVLLVAITIVVLGIVFIWVIDVLPQTSTEPDIPEVVFSTYNSDEPLRSWNRSDEIVRVMVVSGSIRLSRIRVDLSPNQTTYEEYHGLETSYLDDQGVAYLWEPGETLSVREPGRNWNSSKCYLKITHLTTGTVIYRTAVELESVHYDDTGPYVKETAIHCAGECPVINETIDIVAWVYDLPEGVNRGVASVTLNATALNESAPDTGLMLTRDSGSSGGGDWNGNGRADADVWGVTVRVDAPPLGTQTVWVEFQLEDHGGNVGSYELGICLSQPRQ